MNHKRYTLFLFLSSLTIESFCVGLLFIYMPLVIAFNYHNDFLASLYRSFEFLGPVLFGYCAGYITDQINKRLFGFFAIILLAIICTILFLNNISYFNPTFFILMIVFSITSYFVGNLRMAVIPMVCKKSTLPSINSFIATTSELTSIITPAVASLLLTLNKPRFSFALFGVGFFISSILYYVSLSEYQEDRKPATSLSVLDSVRIFWGNKNLVLIVACVMGNNAFVGIFFLHIVLYATDLSAVSSAAAPMLLVLSGISGTIAGLLYPKLLKNMSPISISITCSMGMAMIGLLPLIHPSTFTILLATTCVGALSVFLVISAWTYRQQNVDHFIMGRIVGITSTLFKLAVLISLPISGLISNIYGNKNALLFGSILVFCGSLPAIVSTLRRLYY